MVVASLAKLKEIHYIGSGVSATNTVVVQGHGKVDKAPDMAKVTFTVAQEAKDLKSAQDAVSTKVDAVTASLKKLGIDLTRW